MSGFVLCLQCVLSLALLVRGECWFVVATSPLLVHQLLEQALWAQIKTSEAEEHQCTRTNLVLTLVQLVVVVIALPMAIGFVALRRMVRWKALVLASLASAAHQEDSRLTVLREDTDDEDSIDRHAADLARAAFLRQSSRASVMIVFLMLLALIIGAGLLEFAAVGIQEEWWRPCTVRGRSGAQLWPWVEPPLPPIAIRWCHNLSQRLGSHLWNAGIDGSGAISELFAAMTDLPPSIRATLTDGAPFLLSHNATLDSAVLGLTRLVFDESIWSTYLALLCGLLVVDVGEYSAGHSAARRGPLANRVLIAFGPGLAFLGIWSAEFNSVWGDAVLLAQLTIFFESRAMRWAESRVATMPISLRQRRHQCSVDGVDRVSTVQHQGHHRKQPLWLTNMARGHQMRTKLNRKLSLECECVGLSDRRSLQEHMLCHCIYTCGDISLYLHIPGPCQA